MDVRAFGSRYGFSAALPYASGFATTAGVSSVFPACRGVYVETSNKNADKTLVVQLADSPGSFLSFDHIRTDVFLPISVTAISGVSTVDNIYILY